MKKYIFVTIVAASFVLPALVLAQGFVPLAPITGLTDPTTADSVAKSNNLAIFFNNLYKYLIGLAAALAVIEIILGGLQISTQESVDMHTKGKARIYNAIFGLVLVLAPVLVFSIINPRILNLSVGLEKLPTQPGTSAPAAVAPPGGFAAQPQPPQYTGLSPLPSAPLPAGSVSPKADGTCNPGNALVVDEKACYPIRVDTGTGPAGRRTCPDNYTLTPAGVCRINPSMFPGDVKLF